MFTVAKEHTLPARPDLNAELRAVFVPPTAAMLSAAALVFATATVCAALPAEPQLKWRELAAEDKHRCASTLRPAVAWAAVPRRACCEGCPWVAPSVSVGSASRVAPREPRQPDSGWICLARL